MVNSSHWQALEKLAQQISPVWVALSGGIDSLWLFYFFKNIAVIDACPIFFDHPGVYPEERVIAQSVIADEAGLVLEFSRNEMFAVWGDTPRERCYRCKIHLFNRAVTKASDAVTLCDGSHLNDVPARRPGMRALNELGILSPLRICGWDKSMIREAAQKAGLKTWNQPARSCLVVDGKLQVR
jgi:uncharacterized protein